MPRRAGLFDCFGSGSREQPEIRYEPERHGHGVQLQPIELDIPMPDENELNVKFAELVDELDLSAVHRKAMFDLPPQKKWQIYCSRRKGQQESSMAYPEYYIDRLRTFLSTYYQRDEAEIISRTKFLEELKTALRTQPMSFVLGFLDLGGLQSLIDILANMDWETCESLIHTACIGCLKALMNNSHGRSQVLAHSNCINTIAQSLITDNIKTKIAVLEILGACCLVPGGHKKVLDAMVHFQSYAEERTRFQTLINDLDRSTGVHKDEFNLKIAIMSFVNAALRYGAGADHLEFRIHLRFEFLMLGLQPVMDKLRKLENATLDRHLDFFDMVRSGDEKELSKRYGQPNIDTKSASSILEVLKQKIGHTTSYSHLLSLFQHLLLLPTEDKQGAPQYWKMLDRIVQEIVLQQEDGTDPDVTMIDIHVKNVVERMTIDDFKDDSGAKLAKKEQEIGEMRETVDKMADKLDAEMKAHEEANRKIEELTARLTDFQNRLNVEVSGVGGSIPDDAKIANLQSMGMSSSGGLTSSGGMGPPGGMGTPGGMGSFGNAAGPPPPPAPVAPPPPCPPGIGAPPPPPPPGLAGMGGKKKNSKLPKPSNPLKSFNWAKLPDAKIKGTLWSELDDAQVIPMLDFKEIDFKFSAYQKKENAKDHDEEDKGSKPKELSFIDSRRAQNVQILLSKMKLTNEEITHCMMTMDIEERLSRDVLEQMLKFVPSPDEVNLLESHVKQIEFYARGDRFLYDMSKLPHYEQRLKALAFKKGFNERMSDVKPGVDYLIKACRQLTRSKRLRLLLEIVLALGNYMNRGNRANASGFKLSSLNKIIDTKSSVDRRVTLLHYLLDLIERKFPDIFNLEIELSDVRSAAKVNVGDMSKEVDALSIGLKECDKELEYQHKNKSSYPNDQFVNVMGSFLKVAHFSVSELQSSFIEMKDKFEKTITLFGEDQKAMASEEFFGIFNTFLVSFAEAKGENIAMRQKQLDDERKAKEMAKQKERDRQKSAAKRLMSGKIEDKHRSISERSPGEFDDLISALRTGDVFGDEITNFKGRKRGVKTRSSNFGVVQNGNSNGNRERNANPNVKLPAM